MSDIGEDEAFRREFISKMTHILGIPASPQTLATRMFASKVTTADQSLVQAVKSVKSEIEYFKALVEKYESLAEGMAKKQAEAAEATADRHQTPQGEV